jgi:hypothetical protein
MSAASGASDRDITNNTATENAPNILDSTFDGVHSGDTVLAPVTNTGAAVGDSIQTTVPIVKPSALIGSEASEVKDEGEAAPKETLRITAKHNPDMAVTREIIESYRSLTSLLEGDSGMLAQAATNAIAALHRCGVPLAAKTGRLEKVKEKEKVIVEVPVEKEEVKEPEKGTGTKKETSTKKGDKKDKAPAVVKKSKLRASRATSVAEVPQLPIYEDPTEGGTDIGYSAGKHDSSTVRSELLPFTKQVGRSLVSLWAHWAISASGGLGYGFMCLGTSPAEVELCGVPQIAQREKMDLLWEVRSRLSEVEDGLCRKYDASKIEHIPINLEEQRDRFLLNLALAKVCAQLNLSRECGMAISVMEAILVDLQTYSVPPTAEPLLAAITCRCKLDLEEWMMPLDIAMEKKVQRLLSDLQTAKQYYAHAEKAADVQLQRDALKRIINIYVEASGTPMARGEDPIADGSMESLMLYNVRDIEEREKVDTIFLRKFGKLRALAYLKKLKFLAVPDPEGTETLTAAVEHSLRFPGAWKAQEAQRIASEVATIYAMGVSGGGSSYAENMSSNTRISRIVVNSSGQGPSSSATGSGSSSGLKGASTSAATASARGKSTVAATAASAKLNSTTKASEGADNKQSSSGAVGGLSDEQMTASVAAAVAALESAAGSATSSLIRTSVSKSSAAGSTGNNNNNSSSTAQDTSTGKSRTKSSKNLLVSERSKRNVVPNNKK